MAVQRDRRWVMDSERREPEEKKVMELLQHVSLHTSAELDHVLGEIAAGDVVTVHAHGDEKGIKWLGRNWTAKHLAAAVIANVTEEKRAMSWTLDVFSCFSAGVYPKWLKGKWSPRSNFVYQVAKLLKAKGLDNVTVKGYVGKTRVSLSAFDRGPYKEAGLDQGEVDRPPRRSIRQAAQEFEPGQEPPEILDPSEQWSMSVHSGTLAVRFGAKLAATLKGQGLL